MWWFTVNLVYVVYARSCELISNWYFYVMIHSSFIEDVDSNLVVNWFQIDTFMWWFTVLGEYQYPARVLWIDFKLILLCDDSQSLLSPVWLAVGCELISNWYFYVMIHSAQLRHASPTTVVNWFQIDTFMWWFTVHKFVFRYDG